jgi:hypothetical protein
MKKKVPWNRNDRLAAAGVAVALLAIIVGLLFPEVRRKLGLEKPAPTTVSLPQAQVPKSELPAPEIPNPTPAKTQTHTTTKGRVHSPSAHASSQTPPVGNINQGAGSALSINQLGGVTAGTVVVDAPPDREWRISPLQKAIVCKSPATAHIFAIDTQEAIRFSYKIADVLLHCGWHVPEMGTCQYAGTFNGVWVQSNSADPATPILVDSMEGDFPVRRSGFQEFEVGWVVINVGDNGSIKEGDSLPPCTMANITGGFR